MIHSQRTLVSHSKPVSKGGFLGQTTKGLSCGSEIGINKQSWLIHLLNRFHGRPATNGKSFEGEIAWPGVFQCSWRFHENWTRSSRNVGYSMKPAIRWVATSKLKMGIFDLWISLINTKAGQRYHAQARGRVFHLPKWGVEGPESRGWKAFILPQAREMGMRHGLGVYSRELRIKVPIFLCTTFFFCFVYFSRVPNPPPTKKRQKGSTGGPSGS